MVDTEKIKYDLEYTTYVYFKLKEEKEKIEKEYQEYKIKKEKEIKNLNKNFKDTTDIMSNLKYDNNIIKRENELLIKELENIKSQLLYLQENKVKKWYGMF